MWKLVSKKENLQCGSPVLDLSISGKIMWLGAINTEKLQNKFLELIVRAENRTTCDLLFAYFYIIRLWNFK